MPQLRRAGTAISLVAQNADERFSGNAFQGPPRLGFVAVVVDHEDLHEIKAAFLGKNGVDGFLDIFSRVEEGNHHAN